MKSKSLTEFMASYSNGDIVDYKNPNCKDCNDCCSLFTLISEVEYKSLKKYFTKDKIGISKYKMAVSKFYTMADETAGVYLVCPFSDRGKKCIIYNKRPEICRSFHCSKGERETELIRSNTHTLFDLLKEDIKDEKRLSFFLNSMGLRKTL